MGAIGVDDLAIGDCSAYRDLGFWDEADSVCAKGCFIAMGEATKFVGKTMCPYNHVFGLFDEVTIIICNSSAVVNDRCSYGCEWCCGWQCDKVVNGDQLVLSQIVPGWGGNRLELVSKVVVPVDWSSSCVMKGMRVGVIGGQVGVVCVCVCVCLIGGWVVCWGSVLLEVGR